jgi:hypothetical protein
MYMYIPTMDNTSMQYIIYISNIAMQYIDVSNIAMQYIDISNIAMQYIDISNISMYQCKTSNQSYTSLLNRGVVLGTLVIIF